MSDTITLRRDGIEAAVKVGDVVPMTDGRNRLVVDVRSGDVNFCVHIMHQGGYPLWHRQDGTAYASSSTAAIDIAKLAAPPSVPAEKLRALVERWQADARFRDGCATGDVEKTFVDKMHGEASAFRCCAADALRLLEDGNA